MKTPNLKPQKTPRTARPERLLYTAAEAAAMLHVGVDTLRAYRDSGGIKPRAIRTHCGGTKLLYHRDDLATFASELPYEGES